MTYDQARWAIGIVLYLIAAAITMLVVRDSLEPRRLARNPRPAQVAILASLPWLLAMPAFLVLSGMLGP